MPENSIDKYAITGLATLAGFHQFVKCAYGVGAARRKYGVKPPETIVNVAPEFIRVYRAQQNIVEFMPISMSGLWMASAFFHPVPASLAYVGYVHARSMYFKGYSEDPEKRLAPFFKSLYFLYALLGMSILGVGHKAIRHYGNVDLWELITRNVPALCGH